MSSPDAPVLETLQQSGLDPSTYLVFGGTAMALYGIRPAHDVDLLVKPTVFRELADGLLTPGGLSLVPKLEEVEEGEERLVSIRKSAASPLPLDLRGLIGYRGIAAFNHWMGRADDLETGQGTVHVMKIDDILVSKRRSLRLKDHLDVYKIRAYLKQSESIVS